jgi:hypothetical protein
MWGTAVLRPGQQFAPHASNIGINDSRREPELRGRFPIVVVEPAVYFPLRLCRWRYGGFVVMTARSVMRRDLHPPVVLSPREFNERTGLRRACATYALLQRGSALTYPLWG